LKYSNFDLESPAISESMIASKILPNKNVVNSKSEYENHQVPFQGHYSQISEIEGPISNCQSESMIIQNNFINDKKPLFTQRIGNQFIDDHNRHLPSSKKKNTAESARLLTHSNTKIDENFAHMEINQINKKSTSSPRSNLKKIDPRNQKIDDSKTKKINQLTTPQKYNYTPSSNEKLHKSNIKKFMIDTEPDFVSKSNKKFS